MQYEDFIFGPESAFVVECLEISHSLWPQPIRYVTNVADGVTVTQDGLQVRYEYAVIKIERGSVSNDLDQKITITVGDLGQVVPELLDLIIAENSLELPKVKYSLFSSNDYENPILQIDHLEVTGQNSDYQGTTFEAEAEHLNEVGTGVNFTKENFPTLVGFY